MGQPQTESDWGNRTAPWVVGRRKERTAPHLAAGGGLIRICSQ